MSGIAFLLKSSEALPEDYLWYELERTIRAVRQNPTNSKFRKELIALCMLVVSKEITKDADIDKFVAECEQLSKLHEMFKGNKN